jgi:hypothetical protein
MDTGAPRHVGDLNQYPIAQRSGPDNGRGSLRRLDTPDKQEGSRFADGR